MNRTKSRTGEVATSADSLSVVLLAWINTKDKTQRNRLLDAYLTKLCPCVGCAETLLSQIHVYFVTNVEDDSPNIERMCSFVAFLEEERSWNLIALWPSLGDLQAKNRLVHITENIFWLSIIALDCGEDVCESLHRRLREIFTVDFLIKLARGNGSNEHIYRIVTAAGNILQKDPKNLQRFFDEVTEEVLIGKFLASKTERRGPEIMSIAEYVARSSKVIRETQLPGCEQTLLRMRIFLGELVVVWIEMELLDYWCQVGRPGICSTGSWMLPWVHSLFELVFEQASSGLDEPTRLRLGNFRSASAELFSRFITINAARLHRDDVIPFRCVCAIRSSCLCFDLIGMLLNNKHGDGLSQLSLLSTLTLDRLGFPLRDRKSIRELTKRYRDPIKVPYNVHIAISYLAARPDLHEDDKEAWKEVSGFYLRYAGVMVERYSKLEPVSSYLCGEWMAGGSFRKPEDRWDEFATNKEVLTYEAKASGCAWCGIVKEHSAKLCAGCCRAVYCNRECQSKDWKANHKAECAHQTKASSQTHG